MVEAHLLLDVHQGPHPPCHILQGGAEALATVGEVDPPLRGLARWGRSPLRTLPAYTCHVTWVGDTHTHTHKHTMILFPEN